MLYLAAPPDQIGTASGLFRTFGYLGTITSSVIGSIVFRDGADDQGLHSLGLVLVAAGIAVLLLTTLDRRLMHRTANQARTPRNTDVAQNTDPRTTLLRSRRMRLRRRHRLRG